MPSDIRAAASRPAFDRTDLAVLQALDIDGRASFSRIGAALGISDQTVARRLARMRAHAGARVVAVRDRTRAVVASWTLRLRCSPDAAPGLARALARRADTSWIVLVSGGTEVVVTTGADSAAARDALLLGTLPRTPALDGIRAHQHLHRFFGGPSGWLAKAGALSAEQRAALSQGPRAGQRPGPGAGAGQGTGAGPGEGSRPAPAPAPVPPPYEDGPDPAPEDAALIAALARDGRLPFPRLAELTGRSEATVRRRTARLLASGALFLDVQYDPAAFGFGTAALLWIETEPGARHRTGEALAAHAEIASVTAVTGDCDLTAVLVCRDTRALYAYLSDTLGPLPGVRRVECTPILRQVKQLVYEEGTAG
ncbi:Lrp/AsnC family transcriptional regulator [Streptomyces sp. CA-253872]|uniref:Lrp/AsnC family transcriptional regulator n=1 Tax=Streptomyces sp. CA-253872 TaxID=3240067 RepID=UPI003D8D1B04